MRLEKTKVASWGARLVRWVKTHKLKSGLLIVVLVAYYFCLPRQLFDDSYASVIEAADGELLGAKIARDGQWRFPAQDSVPQKFAQCVIAFEDRHFYRHPGINPVAMAAAFRQNQAAGRIMRGGSTITQQVIRLSRGQRERTYWEKMIEVVLATRLEWRHSKTQILSLYAAHAPYGGNVVGLGMASWRYFGVQPHQLSWAESAVLAVLPNAPALIYPGKNQQLLLEKRNRLLLRLYRAGRIDGPTYQLANAEPLPQKPFALPQTAPHLLERIARTHQGRRIKTTVDAALQHRVNQLARYYHSQYRQNQVHNLAVLVVDIRNRDIIAYVGNAPTDADHQKDVDIITAPRSTGSILKPFLYAAMLDQGELLPNTLVPDVPTQISGYKPENFNLTFDGAVPAHRALARSLNIPSVLMLQDFGVEKFYEELRRYKLRDINQAADHYGLSLILGGAESNLWDLCRTYAAWSSTVGYFNAHQGRYRTRELADLNYLHDFKTNFGQPSFEKPLLGAGSIYLAFKAMEEVNRPDGDQAWKFYDSALRIAWKTGTSFGNRDAWAIGANSRYVVGVWVGNATGEGRPELTGVSSAAPLLFDVFRLLPKNPWFAEPLNDLETVQVCAQSGYLAKEDCPAVAQLVPPKGTATRACPYHRTIHLDKTGQYRVDSNCEAVANMVAKSWFVLPPVMEWYYKSQHLDYRPLPPWRPDCGVGVAAMDFIYPKAGTKIYLTRNFDSDLQPVVLKVAHPQREKKLFWYVDDVYKGATQTFHDMAIAPVSGMHWVTVVDEDGNEIRRRVEIVRE